MSTKWSAFAAGTTVAGTDTTVGLQGGANVQWTWSQALTYIATATSTFTNKTLTSPTLTTPALGTPASGVLTSCTGLPMTTGVTGILAGANGGTGVANTGFTFTLAGTSAIPIVTNPSGAIFQHGAADAASAVAQTIGVQNIVAGTSNTAGALLSIRGSAGTGTGSVAGIVLQTAPAGSTGTAQNAFVNRFLLDADPAGASAINTAGLVNGTSAQAFHVYATSSSANANYERLAVKYDSGNSRFAIVVENSGTGSVRDLALTPSNGSLFVTTASVTVDNSRQYRISGRLNISAPVANVALLSGDSANTSTKCAIAFGARFTVAQLPSASTYDGSLAFVSDATVTTNGLTVVGGGSSKVLVQSNGTNWIIVC